MTASDLLPVLSAFVGAIIGALANGRYRDRQDRKAQDQERKGLLMLIHAEIHGNELFLKGLTNPAHSEPWPFYTDVKTETWTSCRVRLAQLLPREHLRSLVIYYRRLDGLFSALQEERPGTPEQNYHAVESNAQSALQLGRTAMRYGNEYVFPEDPNFNPAIHDAFVPERERQEKEE